MRRNVHQETLPTEPAERLDTNANLRLETENSVSHSAGTERAEVLLTRKERITKRVKKSTHEFFKTMVINFTLVIFLKVCSYLMLLKPFNFDYCVVGLIIIEIISIVVVFQSVKKQREVTNKKTLLKALVKNSTFMDIFSRMLCYLLYFVYGQLASISFTYSCIPFYINSIYQIVKIFTKTKKVNFLKK